MNSPRSREEFERNFNLLHRQLMEGKFRFPVGYPMDSIMRVRYLPNGRIDFLSVDEMARLNANTTGHFIDQLFDDLKDRHPHMDGAARADDDEQPEGVSEDDPNDP